MRRQSRIKILKIGYTPLGNLTSKVLGTTLLSETMFTKSLKLRRPIATPNTKKAISTTIKLLNSP
jgi:hypothetical protein